MTVTGYFYVAYQGLRAFTNIELGFDLGLVIDGSSSNLDVFISPVVV